MVEWDVYLQKMSKGVLQRKITVKGFMEERFRNKQHLLNELPFWHLLQSISCPYQDFITLSAENNGNLNEEKSLPLQ